MIRQAKIKQELHQLKWKDYIINPEVLSPAAKEYYSGIERGVPQEVTWYINRLGNYTYTLHTRFSTR